MSTVNSDRDRRKKRWVGRFHRHLANPLFRRVARFLPGMAIVETTGRRSGLPRRTPVGGRRDGDHFWLVSNDGRAAQYVRNIEADPNVRIQLRGRWYPATAHLLDQDDARERLRHLPRVNSALVRAFGTDHLTIRVDLDPAATGPRTGGPAGS